ncbi:hypothetical protein WN982_22645 [Paraburkholderia sp. IMGN_8]|uniref:hypothetical protein n=1 Tax=Paraburkholderia sp. IMGN_8 TaxID=3136564 RepID=UPI003100C450
MSKSAKQSRRASRPPVDALQYEKLALSAFGLCDRQLSQLDTLVTLAASICRNPAVTLEERRRQQTLLELLVDTAEQYQQELVCDRELFQVIALDAKGIPQSRITANRAARLLEEAAQSAKEAPPNANTIQRKRTPAKSATTSVRADAQQPVAAQH